MNTRSQTIKKMEQLYEVNIDFDGSSEAWKNNKKSIGNGSYKYVCSVEKNGKKCGKTCYKVSLYCWQHRKYNEK
jgi:hypothetical protein